MTKTRRSLMVLLFIMMVLGVGLFLPNRVSKPVNAAPIVKIEFRTSKNLTWKQLDTQGLLTVVRGYAPFDWVTFAVTQPRAFPNAYTPPKTMEAGGNFLDFYGVPYVAKVYTPFATYDTPTTVTYFYRIDANHGGLKAQSSAYPYIRCWYDSNGDGQADQFSYVGLPK
jgi:hypothetical protein